MSGGRRQMSQTVPCNPQKTREDVDVRRPCVSAACTSPWYSCLIAFTTGLSDGMVSEAPPSTCAVSCFASTVRLRPTSLGDPVLSIPSTPCLVPSPSRSILPSRVRSCSSERSAILRRVVLQCAAPFVAHSPCSFTGRSCHELAPEISDSFVCRGFQEPDDWKWPREVSACMRKLMRQTGDPFTTFSTHDLLSLLNCSRHSVVYAAFGCTWSV